MRVMVPRCSESRASAGSRGGPSPAPAFSSWTSRARRRNASGCRTIMCTRLPARRPVTRGSPPQSTSSTLCPHNTIHYCSGKAKMGAPSHNCPCFCLLTFLATAQEPTRRGGGKCGQRGGGQPARTPFILEPGQPQNLIPFMCGIWTVTPKTLLRHCFESWLDPG